MRAELLALIALVASGGRARADTPRDTPAAVEVDRDTAPPGRPELGFDGGAPLEGWGASLSLGWLERPIVLRSAEEEILPVARRQTLAAGGALALGDAVVLDGRFAFAHQVGDRLAATGDPRALDRWVPGDLRVGGRVRFAARPRGAAFARVELTLPTGDDHDLAGEPSWTLAWSLIGRLALPHRLAIAATGGVRLRGAEVALADRLVGDELFGGVGVVVPLPALRPLWCSPEQVVVTGELVGILGDDIAGRRGPSPAEVRFGVITRPRADLAIGVRVGAGLPDEVGAPRWRAVVELTYQGRGRLLHAGTPAGAALAPPRDPRAAPAALAR